MTEASAYTVEEIQEKLESALSKLISYTRKSKRAISAKKDLADFENLLGGVLKLFERMNLDYPDDEEMQKISNAFSSFYSDRHNDGINVQKEKINKQLTDIKSVVHWRKMETSYGKSLGFSDFRSLRGESKKR